MGYVLRPACHHGVKLLEFEFKEVSTRFVVRRRDGERKANSNHFKEFSLSSVLWRAIAAADLWRIEDDVSSGKSKGNKLPSD